MQNTFIIDLSQVMFIQAYSWRSSPKENSPPTRLSSQKRYQLLYSTDEDRVYVSLRKTGFKSEVGRWLVLGLEDVWLSLYRFNGDLSGRVGGFHITQVSLIITQVKNKKAYHLINWVKKLKYRGKVMNKQRAKVSGIRRYSELELFGKGYHWKL